METTTMETRAMETVVRHRDEGRSTWMLNSLVTTKASYEQTGGAFGLMEHLLTPAGNPPLHVHATEDESFYVLEGEIEFEVDGALAHARPGTFLLAPAGSEHRFRVLTDSARMLVVASARGAAPGAGMTEFFEAIGEAATAPVLPVPTAPDLPTVAAAAAAHGIDLTGPPAAS